MTNVITAYDPIFYAQEALIHLRRNLGMANAVYRDPDVERRSTGAVGSVVQIRKPAVLTAQDAPGTAADLNTEFVNVSLSRYREVRFSVPDKEIAYTGQRLIEEHISPAAYALGDDIDGTLALLYRDIPWIHALNATPGSVVTDITGPRRIARDNNVPIGAGRFYYMIDAELEQGLLGNSAFSQWQGAGDVGQQTQINGSLGTRFQAQIFPNQNVKAHTTTAITAITQLQLNAGISKGATSLVIKDTDGTLAGTVKAGDTIVIAGNTQRYAFTADATAAANLITASITPAAAQTYAINSNITLSQVTTTAENLMFDARAFALVFARLPDTELAGQGVRVSTAIDPQSGISVRAKMFYDGVNSAQVVVLDTLYGVKTLDPNLAVRAYAT